MRELATQLLQRIERDAREIDWRDAKIDELTFEMTQLKRLKFGVKSEQLDAAQMALFDEAVDADLAAIEAELEDLKAATQPAREPESRPKRAPLTSVPTQPQLLPI